MMLKRFYVDEIYDMSLQAILEKIHLSQAGVANGFIVETRMKTLHRLVA